MRTLLGLLSIATLLVASNASGQDTTAQADTILDVNKPGNDAFKDWQRPKALNNDSLIAASRSSLGGGTSERSYGATKSLVWKAVLETLSEFQIAVKKADEKKGEIESESEPRASEYFQCVLHDLRGHLGQTIWVKPDGKLVASVKEQSSGQTSLRIRLEGRKKEVGLGGYIGRLECRSNGRLEDTLFQRVQARLAGGQ